MIVRYESEEIAVIWEDRNKVLLWQETELAVMRARVNLGRTPIEVYREISQILVEHPIDLDWWKEREKITRHDLNAFIDERLRFLPTELQLYFHQGMTSYDTEEPAFAKMLKQSLAVVMPLIKGLEIVLREMALKYRYTIMMARTHGQEAELQTFGKRCLTWLRDLGIDSSNLKNTEENLRFSKLSGAIGNYGAIDPEVEKEALKILGLIPFHGATQIMPRELYAPLAQALCQTVLTLHKIALAIRLGARSGLPICQEPFGKRQKGSSAMPHKKNTIGTEQIEGMARMAQGYLSMIMQNIATWEERAIEQSCVERVAWPDLFHVVAHSLKTMTKVLLGLQVYPDRMMQEVINSCGCYASGSAKEFLREAGAPFGLSTEDAYRIVQLAAFNVYSPFRTELEMRKCPCESFAMASSWIEKITGIPSLSKTSIRDVICKGSLLPCSELEATAETVKRWNGVLRDIFLVSENLKKWGEVFSVEHLLRNEEVLYREILGV